MTTGKEVSKSGVSEWVGGLLVISDIGCEELIFVFGVADSVKVVR